MKLRTKAIILIAITWIVFLGFTSMPNIRFSLYSYIIFTVVFAFLTFIFLYFSIIKRIEKLNQAVSELNKDHTTKKLTKCEGSDEIFSIAKNINTFIGSAEETQRLVEQNTGQTVHNLQNINRKLQVEIIKHKATEQQIAKEREEILSKNYNNLNSIHNRILFNEMLNKAISNAKRHKKILAILSINVDFLTNITKTFELSMVDQVFQEIESRFLKVLRSGDVLARLDGDEFVVLLNDISKPKFVSAVAQKLLKTCSLPLTINSHELKLTASIGICVYPNDGESLEILLENVNTALDAVVRAGGNGYQFYTKRMDVEAREYVQLKDALSNALDNGELLLNYQPKFHIQRGNITGVEALVRWHHPQCGMIHPIKFIPLAEESGIIIKLGEWILTEACKTNKHWQDEGYEPISICVNLSPKQFYHPDIVDIISGVLNKTGLDPNYLELEIAETTVMDNSDVTTSIVEKIKALGVQISIDHFGTGYTSISHLKKLPVNAVKIDASFIKGIPNTPNDVAITGAFIALAHNLGLEVVAEGVETEEQVQFLASQNCDMVQGYFLSHPLSAEKIVLQFKKLMDKAII